MCQSHCLPSGSLDSERDSISVQLIWDAILLLRNKAKFISTMPCIFSCSGSDIEGRSGCVMTMANRYLFTLISASKPILSISILSNFNVRALVTSTFSPQYGSSIKKSGRQISSAVASICLSINFSAT